DCCRHTGRAALSMLSECAERVAVCSDHYQDDYRKPTASINFITAHDGFTLHDLVSYNEKHNDANQEGNNDGESHNRSWNCGAEGPTDDEAINALRAQQKRNFLTTLLLSQGVPMLAAGDELGKSQSGNNNAYSQDNELSWLHWDTVDEELLEFTRRLIELRLTQHVFCRRKWFAGKPVKDVGTKDIAWFLPNGKEMPEKNWDHDFARSLGVFLNGHGIHSVDDKGEPIVGDSFYLVFNAYHEPLDFVLPKDKRYGSFWVKLIDTTAPLIEELTDRMEAGRHIEVAGRALQVYRCAD